MKFLMVMAVIRFVFALLDNKNKKNEAVTESNGAAKHPAECWIR